MRNKLLREIKQLEKELSESINVGDASEWDNYEDDASNTGDVGDSSQWDNYEDDSPVFVEGKNPFAKDDEDEDVEECNEGENPFASDEDEDVVDHGTDGAPTSSLAERKAMEVYNKLVEGAVKDEFARANKKVLKESPNLKYNQLYREYAGNRIRF